MNPEPLFEVETPAVRKPAVRPKLPGKPRWTRYRAVKPHRCDDCMRILYETEGAAPLARQAKYRRTTASGDRLLCRAHAQQWREDDKLPALTDDGE